MSGEDNNKKVPPPAFHQSSNMDRYGISLHMDEDVEETGNGNFRDRHVTSGW